MLVLTFPTIIAGSTFAEVEGERVKRAGARRFFLTRATGGFTIHELAVQIFWKIEIHGIFWNPRNMFLCIVCAPGGGRNVCLSLFLPCFFITLCMMAVPFHGHCNWMCPTILWRAVISDSFANSLENIMRNRVPALQNSRNLHVVLGAKPPIFDTYLWGFWGVCKGIANNSQRQ